MALQQRTKISAEAIQKAVPALWGKPRWAALLISYTEEIQELENAIFSVIDSRLLDNATGSLLRVLGKIVGAKDYGYDDETLRAVIRARIRSNVSLGRLKDIREVAELLAPGSPYTICDGLVSGSVVLRWLDDSMTLMGRGLALVLKDARAGGVRLEMTRYLQTEILTYQSTEGVSDPELGWDSGYYKDEDFI